MATFALVDATTWVGGHDFTTDLNSISLNVEAEELDVTTFGGNGYRQRISGLKTNSSEQSGFWDSAPDAESFGNLGTKNEVATTSVDGQEESVAYLRRVGKFSYQQFGAVGEAAPFTLSMMGTDPHGVVRGQVALAKGAVSAPGAVGSPVNLGAVGASQFLYVAFHVFTAATTITLKVESDSAQAFSTPADVTGATIGPVTVAGGTWMTRVAGPVTDTWYRLNATTVTGTFTVAAAIGIA